MAVNNAEPQNSLYYCFRGYDINTKEGMNYGGVFFTNSVRVSSPIMLQEIGFFGPFSLAKEEYQVWIDIWESNSIIFDPGNASTIKRIKGNFIARKREIFFVELPDGLFMQPGFFYHIQFELKGDDTARIKQDKTLTDISVLVDGNRVIKFEWTIGSHQMPAIVFKPATEQEMAKHLVPIQRRLYPKLPLFSCNIL